MAMNSNLWGLWAAIALAQGTAAQSSSTTSPSSTVTLPPHTDDAPSPSKSSDPGNNNNNGLIYHYFFVLVFIALCAVGFALFYWLRRRRASQMQRMYGRQDALSQDVNGWGPARGRRRRWPGQGEEDRPEEGLNENGEAPPPYMPKTHGTGDQVVETPDGPAVPLQTLSRDGVGLKPPDYAETHATPVDNPTGERSNRATNSHAPGHGPPS